MHDLEAKTTKRSIRPYDSSGSGLNILFPRLKLVEVIARPFFFRTWNWKPGDDFVINASVPTEESPEALPQPCSAQGYCDLDIWRCMLIGL